MKTKRHRTIVEIVSSREIYTQEELVDALNSMGFLVTQATVSRDIKELGLVRQPGRQRGLKYVVEGAGNAATPMERIFRAGLVSVDFAGNMLVIKTLSGMAMAVAAALDDMKLPDILGTVAGDDVVMCVVRNADSAKMLMEKLEKLA